MDTEMHDPMSNTAYSEMVLGTFDEVKVQQTAARARRHIGGNADIAFVFVSCDYQDSLADLVELVQIHAHCPRVVGASSGGIIGVGREEEQQSGFSIIVLRLPHTEICAVEMPGVEKHAIWDRVKDWNATDCSGWILLGNPTRIGEDWMSHWNSLIGSTPTYGGLASGSQKAESLFVFNEHGVCEGAALAIGFRGGVKLSGLVSQGCRPIGEPLTITRADQNLIHQLASQNAYEQLQAAFNTLSQTQKQNAQGNILVGLAMSEYLEDFRTGDFLVRSILGGDPGNGVLAVGAMPRVGQTLQFQLRDREAADMELREMLQQKHDELPKAPFATLLFSCGGRGKQLFGESHHDAGLFESAFGQVPLAGFFCNGEIGTVGDKAYLHGFTASGVLLVDA